MASVTGLLAVKGMTSALYGKLAPYLCALPKVGTTINVNTASPLLLHALTPNPGPELDQFLEERLKKQAERSEERRVGKGGVTTCTTRWSEYHATNIIK